MENKAEETGRRDAFSFAAYHATYQTPRYRVDNVPYRRALFREAKRRLEHGVPVDVLIRDVTMKLRAMKRGGAR